MRAVAARALTTSNLWFKVQPVFPRAAMASFSTDAVAAAGASTEGPADEEEEEEEYEEDDDEEYELEGDGEEVDPFDEALTEYFTELDAAAEAAAIGEAEAPLPVKVSGISGSIAADVYRAGLEDNNLYEIYEDLLDLQKVIASSPDIISRFFQHNNYSQAECLLAVSLLTSDNFQDYSEIKNEELAELVVGSEENFVSFLEARKEIAALSLETSSLAAFQELAAKARLDLLKYVVEAYGSLCAAEAKVLPVVVSSAVPLTDDQQKRIISLLPKYGGNTTIDVSFEVEPSTLGGLLITLNNQVIDLSASSQVMETIQEYN